MSRGYAQMQEAKREVQGSTPPGCGQIPENGKQKLASRIKRPPSPPPPRTQNQGEAPRTGREASRTAMEAMFEGLSKWSEKGEALASNIWTNLNTGQSVPDAAWGKLRLGARALAGGGFEPLFKQRVCTDPSEKLKKTYACYLSTSAGPVAGTLYISTVKIAFCSDRPLSFTAVNSEEKARSYSKFAVPTAKVKAVNPSFKKDNPAEKYIQIVAVDDHEFWLMGLVNYSKALRTLQESMPSRAQQRQPPVE